MNPRPLPQSTDPRLKPVARAFVVYDRETGEVLHVHHAVEFANGAPATEADEARAKRLAGRAAANADVLEVPPDAASHRGAKRVDVKNRKLLPG